MRDLVGGHVLRKLGGVGVGCLELPAALGEELDAHAERADQALARRDGRGHHGGQAPRGVGDVHDAGALVGRQEEAAAVVVAVRVLHGPEDLVVVRADHEAVRLEARVGEDHHLGVEDAVGHGARVVGADGGVAGDAQHDALDVVAGAVAVEDLVLQLDVHGVAVLLVDVGHHVGQVLHHLLGDVPHHARLANLVGHPLGRRHVRLGDLLALGGHELVVLQLAVDGVLEHLAGHGALADDAQDGEGPAVLVDGGVDLLEVGRVAGAVGALVGGELRVGGRLELGGLEAHGLRLREGHARVLDLVHNELAHGAGGLLRPGLGRGGQGVEPVGGALEQLDALLEFLDLGVALLELLELGVRELVLALGDERPGRLLLGGDAVLQSHVSPPFPRWLHRRCDRRSS